MSVETSTYIFGFILSDNFHTLYVVDHELLPTRGRLPQPTHIIKYILLHATM